MNRIVNSIEAKDIENHFHPYTNPQTLKETGPHVICRGEGVYVYDNSNTKFIEGMSGLWCASLGFNNKDLVEGLLICIFFINSRPEPSESLISTIA